MEPVLVLRLLIYGVITQVTDPEHACGKVGGAQPTSFRRADGITIVCLPISGGNATTTSFSSSVHQGLTLKLMPSGVAGASAIHFVDDRALKKTTVEIVGKEPKVETTTTVPPTEDKPERKKKKSKKKKEPEVKKEEEEEEEEDEEDDKDKEGKNKRNTELPNNAKKLLPKTVDEPAGVHYSPKEEEGTKKEEEEEEDKEDNNKVDTTKKNIPEISADKLRQLLDKNTKDNNNNNNNNDDDEIEQYILIRRRKKGPREGNNKSKADVLVPLASTSTTETASVDEKPKAKKKRKKKKNKVKDDGREKDEAVLGVDENKSTKHKRHNADEVDESAKTTTTPTPTTPHQIFIINVPITNHNSFNTTLTAPETKTGKKEEDKFEEFLKVFNFVEVGDVNKDKRAAEDDGNKEKMNDDNNNKVEKKIDKREEKKKKKKRKRKQKTKTEDDIKKEEEDVNKDGDTEKHEEEKNGKLQKQKAKTPKGKKDDVVYDLIVNKNKETDKENREHDEYETTTTTTTPKPKKSKRKRKKKKVKVEEEKEDNDSTKEDIHKDITEGGGNGEYKLVKITKVMIKHGNNNKDDDSKVHNSQFHHETGFKTEFEFKKDTDTDNVELFENFLRKNIIGDEQKEGGDVEADRLKQKVEQLMKDDKYGGEEGHKPAEEKEKKDTHERRRRRAKDSGRQFYRFFKRIEHDTHPWAEIRPNRPPVDQ